MAENSQSQKILLVDDDSSALFIYKTHLARVGYQVMSVASVELAMAEITKAGVESFSAVVTDYWMPGETGFDLLRRVRELDKALAVILVTAEGEKEHVAKSLREGAHNFLDKPLSGQVLRDAVAKAVESTWRQRSLRSTLEEAKAMGDSQRLMLGRQTSSLEGRLRIFSKPNAQAGGDFAAAYAVGPDRYVVLVSDVSGHDLKSAYYSAYIQGVAHGMFDSGAELEPVFRRINTLLLDDWNKSGWVELSLAICGINLDLTKQTIVALNCGLPPPFLSDTEGWAVPLGESKANPLGWFDEEMQPFRTTLSGGHLSFWSDGLEDLAAKLGVSPLCLSFRIHQSGDVENALTQQSDDIVAIQLELSTRGDTGRCTRLPLLAQVYKGSQVEEIDAIQAHLDRSLQLALPWVPAEGFGDAVLCIREALINALRHGCGSRKDRHALVQAAYDLKTKVLHFRITDEGNGHLFDYDTHEEVAAEELLTEHRGLVLVKNLASRMHLSARGNRLTMDFPLNFPQT